MSDDIAEHDTSGDLLAAIRDGLERSGTTIERATIDDLAPVDEFHIGGRPATRHLCDRWALRPTTTCSTSGAASVAPPASSRRSSVDR